MKSKSIFYGFNQPFFGGPQNIMSRQEDDRLIKNDLLQLLMTVPGERVMRPTFGTPLRSFVFEQSDDNELGNLGSSIKSAIEVNDKRIIVSLVDISHDTNRNGIVVKIVFSLKLDPNREMNVDQFLQMRSI